MAELRFTYLLDVKDMASRQVAQANARIATSVERTNVAMRQQGTAAESASSRIQRAGARQAAEWKQVERAARTAERTVAQASTQASAAVTRAVERQVVAQRKAGQSFQTIARQQKAAGVSARETAAAIEQASLRETRAVQAASAKQARSRQGVLGGLKGQISSMKGMAGGLAAGFAAFKGLDFIKDAVDETERLAKATLRLQRITGGDTKVASEWVVLAKERGVSAQQLNRAFITMERNQTKATQGVKTSADAFKTLGISQEALKRSSPQQLIDRVATGLHNLGPGARAATVAQQLFGRATQSLLPVLSKGGASVRALREELGKQGAAMDANGVRKALALAAAQRRLNAEMLGVKLTIGQAIIPSLTKGAQALATFIAQMRNGTGTGGQVRKVLEQVWQGAKQLATALAPAAKALATLFGPAARVASTAIGGMTQIIRSVVGIVRGMVAVVTRLLRGDFAGAWRAVKGIVRSALSGLGGLVKTLMAPVYTFAASAVRRAVHAVSGLGSGIAGVLRGAVRGVASAASAVGNAILGAFRGVAHTVMNVWRTVVAGIKTAVSTIKDAIGTVTSLPRKILNNIPFIGGRRGGAAAPGGFHRYQDGGLVPAMLSPGEMVVHGSRGVMVPGRPVAADTVPMMLPVGAAVLTGHGQQLLAQGATVNQAIAHQAPHFQAGGHVRGRLSWFGGPRDSGDSGRTALGLTTATPGVAVRPGDTWQTGRATLGRYWRIRTPNGRSAVLRQTDLGPNQSTGRRIDVTYSALGRLGYTEGSFPTDRVGVADLVGGPAGAGAAAAGSSFRVSGLAQAQARRVGASRTRAGLVGDAFAQGFEQGVSGATRAVLAREGDPVFRGIAGAYRLPAARTVNVPAPGGGGSRAPRASGGRGGALVNARRPIRDTLAWAHAIAAKFGLTINSSYRSPAHNRAVGGVPNSWHTRGSAGRPEAFDFSPPSGAAMRWFQRVTHPAETLIHNAGSGLHLHVGGLYRRGGIVGRFQTGGRVPRYTYAVGGERGRVIRGDEFGVYNQPQGGFGARLGAAMYAAESFKRGTFARLNAAIQDAAEAKLMALRKGVAAAVKRGGTEAQVKRLQGALSLIDKELGRRSGLLERRIAQRTARADTLVARTDIALRLAGTSPDSAAGITARLAAEQGRGASLGRTRGDLERQLRRAVALRNRGEIDRIKAAIEDNITALKDSQASQAELARARADQTKADRNAVYEYVANMAGSKTSLAQAGLQTLELQQRLAGSYDTGGQARAEFIRSQIVPDLQAEQAAIETQRQEAVRQGNQQLAAQLAEALAGKGNEVLQALLDVKDATETTAENTDPLKQLGGSLAFEFGGARLTDALYSSGIGA